MPRSAAAPEATGWKRAVPWLLVAALAVVAGVTAWGPWRTPSIEASPMHLRVELMTEGELFADYGAATLISPDGRKLVFVPGNGASRSCSRAGG